MKIPNSTSSEPSASRDPGQISSFQTPRNRRIPRISPNFPEFLRISHFSVVSGLPRVVPRVPGSGTLLARISDLRPAAGIRGVRVRFGLRSPGPLDPGSGPRNLTFSHFSLDFSRISHFSVVSGTLRLVPRDPGFLDAEPRHPWNSDFWTPRDLTEFGSSSNPISLDLWKSCSR